MEKEKSPKAMSFTPKQEKVIQKSTTVGRKHQRRSKSTKTHPTNLSKTIQTNKEKQKEIF